MSENPPILYWDAPICLAYLDPGPQPGGLAAALGQALVDNRDRRCVIVTSAMTFLACAPSRHPADAARERDYRALFSTRNCFELAVDATILTLARDIADYYAAEEDLIAATAPERFPIVDAIHLATGILGGATEFWTIDQHRAAPLTRLVERGGGRIAGRWPLVIRDPGEPLRVAPGAIGPLAASRHAALPLNPLPEDALIRQASESRGRKRDGQRGAVASHR